MKTVEGNLTAKGHKVCIIAGRWNEFFTSKLVSGAVDTLVRHGASADDIVTIWVPGGLEMSLAAKKAAQSKRYDALICVGAVLQGGTAHNELVASEMVKGLAAISLATEVPITNGVITAESIEQAIERSGSKVGNRGSEAALAAIEMVELLKKL